MSDLRPRLEAIIRASPSLMHVMTTARDLALPDWLIFAGAIYQAVWNHQTGRHPDYGIKDYDLAYHDASDLSYEAEDAVIQAAAARFESPFREQVEVRNQARVHLWFEGKFKEPYEPLTRSAEAVERFTSPAFCVAARLESDDSLTVVAPFGLEDMFAMHVRPNPRRPTGGLQRTFANAKGRWPELTIEL